jgi:hypothetical protein
LSQLSFAWNPPPLGQPGGDAFEGFHAATQSPAGCCGNGFPRAVIDRRPKAAGQDDDTGSTQRSLQHVHDVGLIVADDRFESDSDSKCPESVADEKGIAVGSASDQEL